jgi:hypothetical protein
MRTPLGSSGDFETFLDLDGRAWRPGRAHPFASPSTCLDAAIRRRFAGGFSRDLVAAFATDLRENGSGTDAAARDAQLRVALHLLS